MNICVLAQVHFIHVNHRMNLTNLATTDFTNTDFTLLTRRGKLTIVTKISDASQQQPTDVTAKVLTWT